MMMTSYTDRFAIAIVVSMLPVQCIVLCDILFAGFSFLFSIGVWLYRVAQKNLAPFFPYALTLPNINRFSKLFHCQNQEKICYNTVTKDPTTPPSVTTHFKESNNRKQHVSCLSYCLKQLSHRHILHQGGPKAWHKVLYALTSPGMNWFSLIVQLVSGVDGLSASSSSKVDTLNIWCNTCRMRQLL